MNLRPPNSTVPSVTDRCRQSKAVIVLVVRICFLTCRSTHVAKRMKIRQFTISRQMKEHEAEMYDSGRRTKPQLKWGRISVLMTQYLSNQKLGVCRKCEYGGAIVARWFAQRFNHYLLEENLPCVCGCVFGWFTEFMLSASLFRSRVCVSVLMNGSTPSTSSSKTVQKQTIN